MVKSSTVWLGFFASLFTTVSAITAYALFLKTGVFFLILATFLWTVFAEEIRIQKTVDSLNSCNKKLKTCKKF